ENKVYFLRRWLEFGMSSMYLCLSTSICKGVSERPRIRRAVTRPASESSSVMTECARVTSSTAALMMSCLELYVAEYLASFS
uniref:Uncharacterized protein n=1 Tax=Pavo cristatus TaxID=9049 RepID=A0A8C9FQW1_PAVCR